MNATTPPKLMPPFHSTAASGTLPIEQTNDTTATTGPHSAESTGWSDRKKFCQNDSGTQAATAPAINRPITKSRRIAAHSMTKTCATAVKSAPEPSRRTKEPSVDTDMSIAA